MKFTLIGFYYLYIFKKGERKTLKYGNEYYVSILLQNVILFLFSFLLVLLFNNIITISFFTLSTIQFPITYILVDKARKEYADICWVEREKIREKANKEREEFNKKLEKKRAECIRCWERLRNVTFECGVWMQWSNNVYYLGKRISKAQSIETLDIIIQEIENTIILIQREFKKRQEERSRTSSTSNNKNLAYYLKVLGLDPNEKDMDVIRKIRKQLAMKYHPDNKETGDLKKMQEINDAYDNIEKILK